jgi:hypothetical protein
MDIRKQAFNFIKNKATLIFCLVMGVLFYSSTPKIHNSGLMGAYIPPNFPDATTGMSILRLWTYVDKFEFVNFGSLYFSNHLPYGLLSGWLIYLICNRAAQNQTLERLLLVLPGLLIIIYYAAMNGPLYDMTFTVSLLICTMYLIDCDKNISSVQILKLGFWVTLMYMSRPFGMYFALVIYSCFFCKIGRRIIPACIITILFMVPLHLYQLHKFDTFTLSTYGGTNLAEGLASSGENPNQFLDCKVILGRQNYDSKEMVNCSKVNKNKALELYKNKPEVLLNIFGPKRLFTVFIFPRLFWTGTYIGFEKSMSKELRVVTVVCYLSLFFTYLIIFLNFKRNKFYFIPLLFFAMGIFFSAMGSDGSEAIRIFMPFIAIAYLVVTNK